MEPDKELPFSSDVLLARQPIFDRNLGLHGYELLYRQNNQANHADFLCGDNATASLLLNTYASLSQATEHHRVPAFINITENLITNQELLPVDPEMVVLEILEDVNPNQKLIDSIKRYKSLGFKIALDDYPFTPEFETLLEHADFIKVDVLAFDLEVIKSKLNHLKNFDAHLLAEKVENHEMFVNCLKLGFHLFQGYFFERPQIVRGKHLSTNKLSIMQILGSLYSNDAIVDDIADLVVQDAGLSYRLLRIINSAAYSLPRKVQSIKDAVVFLGLSNLKRWVSLLALSSDDETPPELIKTLLVRARCCELLAEITDAENSDEYFTAGLFSGIDSLLGADLDFLLADLPLVERIKQAILQYQGDIGATLKLVIQFGHAQWENLPTNINTQQVNQCYLKAIKWCDETSSSIYS